MDGPARLVVHLGGAPTAAWVINKVTTDHAGELGARGVQVVPSSVVQKTIDAQQSAVDQAAFAAVLEQAVGPDTRTVCLSTEALLGPPFGAGAAGLFPHAGPMLEAVAAATPGMERTVVLSVCPQAQFLESYFTRMTSLGDWTEFTTWLAGIELEHLSWDPLRRQLNAVFGSDEVQVIRFDRAGHGMQPFLAEFAELIGPGLGEVVAPTAEAAAHLSQKGLELAIAARPHLRSWDDRNKMRRFLMREFADTGRPAMSLLSADDRRALDERYRAELSAEGTI